VAIFLGFYKKIVINVYKSAKQYKKMSNLLKLCILVLKRNCGACQSPQVWLEPEFDLVLCGGYLASE